VVVDDTRASAVKDALQARGRTARLASRGLGGHFAAAPAQPLHHLLPWPRRPCLAPTVRRRTSAGLRGPARSPRSWSCPTPPSGAPRPLDGGGDAYTSGVGAHLRRRHGHGCCWLACLCRPHACMARALSLPHPRMHKTEVGKLGIDVVVSPFRGACAGPFPAHARARWVLPKILLCGQGLTPTRLPRRPP
jgi:hypothetical protein